MGVQGARGRLRGERVEAGTTCDVTWVILAGAESRGPRVEFPQGTVRGGLSREVVLEPLGEMWGDVCGLRPKKLRGELAELGKLALELARGPELEKG